MRRRHEATGELRALMVAGRGLVAHVFGPGKLAEVGFAARIEEGSEELLEQATAVVAQVRDPGFVTPAPLLQALRLDLRDLATDLEPAIGALRDALEELAARADFTLALHDRNVALEAFNDEFLHVARIVEGLLRRAGFDDLAERVRPSTRRRGVTEVPFVEEDAPRLPAEPEGLASGASPGAAPEEAFSASLASAPSRTSPSGPEAPREGDRGRAGSPAPLSPCGGELSWTRDVSPGKLQARPGAPA